MKTPLKGGLIGLIIGIPLGIIISFSIMSSGMTFSGGGSFHPMWILAAIMWTPPIAAVFFGLGYVVGWTISKIKSKK